ncbi:MAG: hypothetical protein BRC29_03490 [Nanohaloarchaea archaeon SW_7_43_1]|nr:MAG: hypothetical protein BRC29_03490 [Nanohaloarchaea archaeon SW_7_43_1]
MAKTLQCEKVVKKEFDGEKKPEFQTTWKPENEDEEDGVFKVKTWSTGRIAEKDDKVALKDLSDLMEKAEGQGDLEEFS